MDGNASDLVWTPHSPGRDWALALLGTCLPVPRRSLIHLGMYHILPRCQTRKSHNLPFWFGGNGRGKDEVKDWIEKRERARARIGTKR